MKWRISSVALAAIALVAALVAMAASNGTPAAAGELEEQSRTDAALSQLLAAHRGQGSGYHQNGKELAKARMAMRDLEHSLQGELSSVKAALGQLHRQPVATTALHAAPAAEATVLQGDAAWQKKTMQRGALQGESTVKQLTRVLEKELSDKIHKKLKWSKTDLEKAADFAKYLTEHPLPKLDVKPKTAASARLQGGGQSGDDSVTSKRMDDGVIKVTFKREMTMTDKQYREMEDALQDSYSKENESTNDDDDDEKSTTSARLRKFSSSREDREDREDREEDAPKESRAKKSRSPSPVQSQRLRKIFREEDAKPRPVTDSQRNAEKVLDWKQTPLRDNYHQAHRQPQTWTVPHTQGEEVKRILEKVLGVGKTQSTKANSLQRTSLAKRRHATLRSEELLQEAKKLEFVHMEAGKHVKYTSQPGDSAVLLAQQRVGLSDHEMVREHGEFVHLPPRSEMMPVSVEPYYWKTLPARARAGMPSDERF